MAPAGLRLGSGYGLLRAWRLSGGGIHPKKLIILCANYAEGRVTRTGDKPPPPCELELAWDIEKWGLPEAGGYLNQPLELMTRLNWALVTYNAFKGWKGKDAVKFSEAFPETVEFCYEIVKWREEAESS